MATGVVIGVAQKVFGLLSSQVFEELCSMVGYESQLEELALTVSTIQADLLDAELRQQELTHAGRDYIEKLKDAVYDFDDVLDEFNTRALQKAKVDDNIFEKVRCFFSTSNQLLMAYNMSHEIKKTKEKLDRIAKNRREFGFRDVYEPPKKRNETGSYVAEFSVIGREDETEAIVKLLVGESHGQENVGYVTVVGMGGLGKTTLAQLVYNDKRIKDAFDVTKWVCVSNEFGMEQILAKMTGKNVGYGMEELQREARNMIERRKYLLVLDDVWDENRNKWNELQDFLMLGGNGSRVLATTRSKAVAGAIENNYMYVLNGLSDENSWLLFERKAFGKGKAILDHDLVDIGKEVVKKCANVPLSIGVLGSLLYGQPKSKWLSFRSVDLRKLGSGKDGQAEDGVMPILKYSYYDLSPSLKSCFSYCALFPKDFLIGKTKLMWLWMAHGCLDAEKDGRTMESVGDDCFSILVNRCFFQEVEFGALGENCYYKMHDLIHDLALEVAGKESFALETSVFKPDRKLRHLSIANDGRKLLRSLDNCLGEMKKLRTLLHNFYLIRYDDVFFLAGSEPNVNVICSNLRRLRVLNLSNLGLKSLPNTLGNLSHLRYLDLFYNRQLEILPESITQLQNLLVLNLAYTAVRELPKGLRNLCNLRYLGLTNCWELTHMPVGMDSMVNLETLSMFVVAGETSKQVKKGHLKDLKSLVHLGGRLEIVFRNGFSYDLADAMEVDCLLIDKVRLNELIIRWENNASDEQGQEGIHDLLLVGLRPHSNIKTIKIEGFKGVKLSSWVGSLAVLFPCLVEVSLAGFNCLFSLPLLSQLLHLKVLKLSSMPNIEFIDCDEDASSSLMSTVSDELKFFPSLEALTLMNLPKLKGIRTDVISRKETDRKLAAFQSFLRLKKLEIQDCACLTAVPRCPSLRNLSLIRVHEDFRFGSISDDSPHDSTLFLGGLTIDNIALVNSLFGESLEGIRSLEISGFRQEMFSEAANLFRRHASSIRYLDLDDCNELKNLCGGIEHLTNLAYLCIKNSSDVDLGEEDNCVTSPWKSLTNLSELNLWSLSNLKYLPRGFRHLTSLEDLIIVNCSLESLPEWLPSLTSLSKLCLRGCSQLKALPEAISQMPALTKLQVWDCKHLTDRCRENGGQDWPKISHIQFLEIK